MQSPLKGRFDSTGWTGHHIGVEAPKTVERKRKGRGVDVIGAGPSLPTPPAHLPTPETVRRSGRNTSKPHTSTHLPTPQTQRTRRRAPSAEVEAQAPSPSGHTTFFLSSTALSRPEKIRRRPGLTFAQQMGLISSSADKTRGVGVGIGGHKTAGHKVDQIGAMPKIDENPFLVPTGPGLTAPVGLASPGAITIHRPSEPDSDSEAEGAPMLSLSLSPRRSPRVASPSPSSHISNPALPSSLVSGGLLSPPPTRHAPRIGVLGTNGKTKALTRVEKEARERVKREAEARRRMLDIDDNPFLVKPGEPSTRRSGPIVNEDLPTVTYVFRGARKVFANPLYPSRAPFPQANLNPEDDEFEPHPLPQPKLLWPTGPSPSKRLNLEARTPSPDPEASPPSSPVATPTMSRRFGRQELARGDSLRVVNDPVDVFSEDEGEVILRNSRHAGEEHEHDGEHELPSTRGLLFGAAVDGHKGLKRGLDLGSGSGSGSGDEGRAKKARGLFRL